MAHPYHHAKSSAQAKEAEKGKTWRDHFELHHWMDHSKMIMADPRHRGLLHHTYGPLLAKQRFPTSLDPEELAKRHIIEDLGEIPSLSQWLPATYWPNRLPLPHWARKAQEETIWQLVHRSGLDARGDETKEAATACAQILLVTNQGEEFQGEPANPLRFFYFNAWGPFLCESILGPVTEPQEIPHRGLVERLIRTLWNDQIPSFQDLMANRPIEDWMFVKARPQSKELKSKAVNAYSDAVAA